jgi:hypothetical protein
MFAIVAAILFGVALLMNIIGHGAVILTLALAGLLCLALAMALPGGITLFRRS